MKSQFARAAKHLHTVAVVDGNMFLALGAVFCYGISQWMKQMKVSNIKKRLHFDALYFRFVAGIFKMISVWCAGVAGGKVMGVEMESLKGQALTSLSVVVGLASGETLSNLASALMLMIAGPFEVGDSVETCGHTATVVSVGFFTTHLRSGDNDGIVIPNSMVAKGIIRNKFNNFDSSEHQLRKATCNIYIDVDADLEEAVAALKEAGDEVVELVKEKHACPHKQMANSSTRSWEKQKSSLSDYYQKRYHPHNALGDKFTHTLTRIPQATKLFGPTSEPSSCGVASCANTALDEDTHAEVKTTVKVAGQDINSGFHLQVSTMCEGTIVGDIVESLFRASVRKLKERGVQIFRPLR